MYLPETTRRNLGNPAENTRLSPADTTDGAVTHGNVDAINRRPEKPENPETDWWVRQGSNL